MRIQTTWAVSCLVFIYIISSLTLSGIPGWSRISALTAIILALSTVLLVATDKLALERWVVLPVAFLCMCAVFALLAAHRPLDVLYSVTASWIGAICVSLSLRKHTKIHVVLVAMVAASLANAIAVGVGFDSYARYTADFRYVYEASLRPSGLVGNPNLLAVQAILPLFLFWHFRAHLKGRIWQIVWAIAVACAAYSFFMSGSRKGLMLLLVFFTTWLVTSAKFRGRGLAALGILVIAVNALLLAVQIAPITASETEGSDVLAVKRALLALSGHDTSYEDRLAFVELAWELFLASPIWGYGLDAFRGMNTAGLYSHNNFLELAVSGGVVLLSFYYIMFARILFFIARGVMPLVSRVEVFMCLFALVLTELSMVTYDSRINVLILMILLGYAFRASRSRHRSDRYSLWSDHRQISR